MKDRNEVTISGVIRSEPRTSTTKAGEPMCSFQLAVARPEPSRAHDYLDVVVWQPLAAIIIDRLQAGKRLRIRGCLRKSSYDGNDGRRHSSTKVEAKEIEELTEEEEETAEAEPFPSLLGAAA